MQKNADLLADVSGKPRVADRIIELLVELGVTHVFSMPAETINAYFDAARRNPAMHVISVRHEGNGALMASAYAKLGGRLGVVIGAGGPGATHLPIGAYDAKADHAPVLLVAGQVPLAQLGAGSFQEIDTLALFADACEHARLIGSELQIEQVAWLCVDAISRRRPVHLAVAQDVLTRPLEPDAERPPGPRPHATTPIVGEAMLERCADALVGTPRSRGADTEPFSLDGVAAIVVGAVESTLLPDLLGVARRMAAPLVVTPEGMHLLRELPEWPYLRVAGPLRSEIVEWTRSAERVLSVGPPTAALAELLPDSGRVVQLIPPAAREHEYATRGRRLCGELEQTLARLRSAIDRLEPAAGSVDPRALELAAAQRDGGHVHASLDWAALDRAAPVDAILTVEPGALLDELVMALPVRRRLISSSFNHGARGYALPAAIGASLAQPARRALAIASPAGLDESMAALLTAARHGLAITCVCAGMDAGSIDFVEYARALGLEAELVDDTELEPALRRALQRAAASLVGVRARPAEPALSRTRAASPPVHDFASWLVEALARTGVDRIYGCTRARVPELVRALAARDDIELLEPRHQESAAMMASARVKAGAPLGVCFATDASDLTQLLNGLYDAAFDHVPLLVLGPKPHAGLDPARLLAGVARVSMAIEPDARAEARLEQLIAEALRGQTVVHALLDWHALAVPLEPPSEHFDPRYAEDELLPDAAALDHAAERLRAAERPVLLVGRGATGASEVVEALAERLQAPIVTTFPGRALISPAHPHWVGCVGSSGHRAAEEALQWCDLLIVLGSSSRGSVFYRTAFPTHHAVLQIDRDPRALGRRRRDCVNLCGSIAPTLQALLERLGAPTASHEPRARLVPRLAARVGFGRVLERISSERIEELDDGFAKRMLQGIRDLPVSESARAAAMKLQGRDRGPLLALVRRRFERWLAARERLLDTAREPIPPPAIAIALERALERNGRPATITVDVGVSTLWLFRYFTAPAHRLLWTSSFATMGFAVPAAVALADAHRDPTIAWTGDGGIAITMAEFATAVARRLPVLVVVINNGAMAAAKWELEVMGWPDLSSTIHDCDFARYARACGGRGRRIERPEELVDAIASALAEAETGPTLLDVVCDPNYGPFPPKIHYSQSFGYAVALAREAALDLRGDDS